jgi:hypothetical protein
LPYLDSLHRPAPSLLVLLQRVTEAFSGRP